jgi:hypothetical protein
MQMNQDRHEEEIIDDYDTVRLRAMTLSFQNNIHTIANARGWLAEFGQVLPADWACNFAAQFGRLEILKYFKQQGCGWTARTCAMAAVGGHLLVLSWLRDPNNPWGQCPWDKWTCTYAASYGYLNILQWARHNGCDWEEFTCNMAARSGHLDILQWAIRNGCDWSAYYCYSFARDNGHHEVALYIEGMNYVYGVRNGVNDEDETEDNNT